MTDVMEARTETRRRRKAERPHEILEAAFTEFSRNGYADDNPRSNSRARGRDQRDNLRLL